MNREELIKVLKDWKPELELMAKYNDNSIDYQRYRALDETTKALEQEPCEDCISREEALNIIDFEDKWIFNDGNVYSPVNVGIALTSMKKKIKELPSIQPKPKTDVLDKIRAEIHATAEMHEDGDYYLRDEWIDEIIDKYKAESEDKE